MKKNALWLLLVLMLPAIACGRKPEKKVTVSSGRKEEDLVTGPGCSSVAYGAAQELGPFLVRTNGGNLTFNDFSWNKVEANMLFLEAPVGVGFSYTNNSVDLGKLGDQVTAEDSLDFLINWFTKFPEFRSNDFYLTGESYAGHYVPQLAEVIYDRNKKVPIDSRINLKGFMIGNAAINEETDMAGLVDYAWSHASVLVGTSNCLKRRLEANRLFLEAPVGVGFSYTNNSVDLGKLGDQVTAEDSLDFLINWFTKFPEFRSSEFYLTGESYAGHYVPQLAEVIYDRNGKMHHKYVLRSATAKRLSHQSQEFHVDSAWSHTIVSDDLHSNLHSTCRLEEEQTSNRIIQCLENIKAFMEAYNNIDIYSIYTPVCLSSDSSSTSPRRPKLVVSPSLFTYHDMWDRFPAGYDPCTEGYTEKYFNRKDVQVALHANVTNLPYPYTPCRPVLVGVIRRWGEVPSTVLPIIQKLLTGGLRIRIYMHERFVKRTQRLVGPNSSTLKVCDGDINRLLHSSSGPGCSSVAYGAAQELGPFLVRTNGGNLTFNDFSWNKVEANMLFLEAPVGVGFSYTNNSVDLGKLGDQVTAEDSLDFLINWFTKFPEFRSNDFYLTGESYAGHYVPQLAEVIYDRNKKVPIDSRINLKGFMIGNAAINEETDMAGLVDYAWSHAIVSDELHSNIHSTCRLGEEQTSNTTIQCYENIKAFMEAYNDIDIYSIYTPVCLSSDSSSSSSQRRPKLVVSPSLFTYHDMWDRFPAAGYDPCTEAYTENYFNRKDVQVALHANVTNLPYPYTPCSGVIRRWGEAPTTVFPIIQKLLTGGLRIWIYSGDTDGRVPVTSTRYSIKKMGSKVELPWRSWFHESQVAGWVETYAGGLTFATVRGAGHQVPVFAPAQSLTLFSHFLSSTPLPSKRF
ncbi:hypothetical protein DY000_02019483 [Brassica cretica]|uniref:Carboxypeptidase n=1 Tax=Brassica cretica TaxID=69181 RepID=A0ABQ7CMT9_BRACR|nr:hypothetical protein DY000_02019483 [Brassica cretica]